MANRDPQHRVSWLPTFLVLAFTSSLVACPGAALRKESAAAIAAHGLRTLEGGYFGFGAHRDDVLVVTFFATWCMPCLAEIPYLKDLDRRPGVRVVAISVDGGGVRMLQPFRRHFEIPYTILLADPEMIAGRSPFGKIPAIPATFLLTRGRKVYATVLGGIGPAAFDPLLAKALEAK